MPPYYLLHFAGTSDGNTIQDEAVNNTGEKSLQGNESFKELPELYICPICKIQLKNKNYLSEHINLHSTDKQFECEICHNKFKKLRYLVKHVNVVHSDERPFKCKHCEKTFKYECYLKVCTFF